MVDRAVFRDERKTPVQQLQAINHSVLHTTFLFVNPFTRTQTVHMQRTVSLREEGGGGSSDMKKMMNPLGLDDGDGDSPRAVEGPESE